MTLTQADFEPEMNLNPKSIQLVYSKNRKWRQKTHYLDQLEINTRSVRDQQNAICMYEIINTSTVAASKASSAGLNFNKGLELYVI